MFCVTTRIQKNRVKTDIEAYRGQRCLKSFETYGEAERYADTVQEIADGQHKSRLDRATQVLTRWIQG